MYGYFNTCVFSGKGDTCTGILIHVYFVFLFSMFSLTTNQIFKKRNLNFCSVSHVVLDHFCLVLQCFHSAHKDRTVVELLENGEEILPSDVGLCTYTPTGAYTFLLESLHESLHIDWQLSIVLSQYSIT